MEALTGAWVGVVVELWWELEEESFSERGEF